jgi:hypothetical protein
MSALSSGGPVGTEHASHPERRTSAARLGWRHRLKGWCERSKLFIE